MSEIALFPDTQPGSIIRPSRLSHPCMATSMLNQTSSNRLFDLTSDSILSLVQSNRWSHLQLAV